MTADADPLGDLHRVRPDVRRGRRGHRRSSASEARAASSMAVGTLGVCYVLRGYLDSSGCPDWVTWLTPLGWLEETRPATENNPWPLLLALAFAVLLVRRGLRAAGPPRLRPGHGRPPARPGPRPGCPATPGAWRSGCTAGSSITPGSSRSPGWACSSATSPPRSVTSSPTNPAIGAVLAAERRPEQPHLRLPRHDPADRRDHRRGHGRAGRAAHPRRGDRLPRRAAAGRLACAGRPTSPATRCRVRRPPASACSSPGVALGWSRPPGRRLHRPGRRARQAIVTVPAVWVLVALAIAVVGAAPRSGWSPGPAWSPPSA